MPFITEKEFEARKSSFGASGAKTSGFISTEPSPVEEGKIRTSAFGDIAKPEGIFSRLKTGFSNVAESLRNRAENIETSIELKREGEAGFARTVARTTGQLLGGVGDVAGEAFATALSVLTKLSSTQEDEAVTREFASRALQKAVQTETGQSVIDLMNKFEDLKQTDPGKAADISAALGLADFASNFIGLKVGQAGLKGAIEGLSDVGTGIGRAVKGKVDAFGREIAQAGQDISQLKIPKTVSEAGEIVGEKLGKAKRFALSVPERIESTAEESVRKVIEFKALPEASKQAVSSGVLIRHANLIAQASEPEKNLFKKMFNQARLFAQNRSKIDPADFAGRELQKRIKDSDDLRKAIGKELDDVAKNLSDKIVPDANQSIFNQLLDVPDLDGIELGKGGKLDFSATTLAATEAKGERDALQTWFNDVLAAQGDAVKLHKLRQRMFTSLGGRKKAGVVLTGTEERAVDAMRKGIADSLVKLDDQYRLVNIRYAKVAEPLKVIRSFHRGLERAAPDVLDEASGVLMRRLTGKSVTGPRIKQAINDLNAALTEAGKAPEINIQEAQDFINALDRYFDIVEDTSHAGQIKLAVSDVAGKRGFTQKVIDTTAEVVSGGLEVQQKAIERLLIGG